jgi:putative transposase
VNSSHGAVILKLALSRETMPSASRIPDLVVIPEEKWSIARVRSEALHPLIGLQPLNAATVEKRAVECGVHKSTLYRWLRRYKENATMSSLLPKSPGSAKGSRRVSDRADRIMAEIIEGRYLTRQRLAISLLQRDVALRCREEGVGTPSESTLRRRIREIPRAVELRRREGGYAAQTVEPLHGSFDGADAPLSVIQIDHTPLDLILVDDIHRLPIGRAFLTLASASLGCCS